MSWHELSSCRWLNISWDQKQLLGRKSPFGHADLGQGEQICSLCPQDQQELGPGGIKHGKFGKLTQVRVISLPCSPGFGTRLGTGTSWSCTCLISHTILWFQTFASSGIWGWSLSRALLFWSVAGTWSISSLLPMLSFSLCCFRLDLLWRSPESPWTRNRSSCLQLAASLLISLALVMIPEILTVRKWFELLLQETIIGLLTCPKNTWSIQFILIRSCID